MQDLTQLPLRGLREKNDNARTVVKQSLFYIFDMLRIRIVPLLQLQSFNIDSIQRNIVNLKIFVMPLLGFFNFRIFMYHKIHDIWKTGDERSAREIFVELMKSEAKESIFLSSRISIHHFDDHQETLEMRMNLELGNEDVVSYSPGSQWEHLEQDEVEVNHSPNHMGESMVSSQVLS